MVWEKGTSRIGIEIKSSSQWKPQFSKTLESMLEKKWLNKAYGVYLGSEILRKGELIILPLREFMHRAANGELFG